MGISRFRNCASALAICSAFVAISPAWAQDQEAESDTQAGEASGLNVIVVTASPGTLTQLESSAAITAIDDELIETFRPQSESELYRLLPGIQVGGAGGAGGNANISVRGLPVATGGAPFIQIQEDGLPTVLFGDIQFGNNDLWTRFDATTAAVEAIRGGSSTTRASQAPGAVINYISHTGEDEGGYVRLEKGVDYSETKVSFRYGGPLGDGLYFHAGGYLKRGNSPNSVDYTVSDSIQIKANVTKEFGEDGASFLRLFFKYADTHEPYFNGSPALADVSGNKVSNVRPFPGFDGRSDSNYSIYNQDQLILNREGVFERVAMDGISTKQKSIGGHLHYEVGDHLSVDNRMRYADASGRYSTPFFGMTPTANVIGSTVNGATVAQIRYANGPNAGALYTDTYLDNNVNVTTNIRDVGHFANDLTVTGLYPMAGGELTAAAGFFYFDQAIAYDWHVNQQNRALFGDNPAQLDLFDAAGNALSHMGISGYNNNWGSCCARDVDLGYTNTAPYFQLVYDHDAFSIDGSVRFERVNASGYAIGGGNTFQVAPDPTDPGLLIDAITANGPREVLDYSRSYTSWTIGALYKVSSDVSAYARASRGGRFNADRQTLSGRIASDGHLCTADDAAAGAFGCASDGVTPSVDFVNQYEVGVKARGRLGAGRFTAELALLKGDFAQSTTQLNDPDPGGLCPGTEITCLLDQKFKSKGAEFYGTYQLGGFSLALNATYSKARLRGAGATAFRRANNLPDLTYTAALSYDIQDIATIGVSASGQSSTFDSTYVWEGKTTFNANLAVRPIENVELTLGVYNLFNTLDFRGVDTSVVNAATGVVRGNPIYGRNITAGARLSF